MLDSFETLLRLLETPTNETYQAVIDTLQISDITVKQIMSKYQSGILTRLQNYDENTRFGIANLVILSAIYTASFNWSRNTETFQCHLRMAINSIILRLFSSLPMREILDDEHRMISAHLPNSTEDEFLITAHRLMKYLHNLTYLF